MSARNHRIAGIVFVLSLILSAAPAQAQQPAFPYAVDTHPSRGIMPTSEQLSGPLDSIDPVTGKLHIQIPLASLPAGNAGSGFDLSLAYDSHQFDLGVGWITKGTGEVVLSQTVMPSLTTGGWAYNFKNYRIQGEGRMFPPDDSGCGANNYQMMEHEREFRYRISLPDGSQHVLHLLGYGDEKDGYYGDGFYAIDIEGKRGYCARSNTTRYPSDVNGTLTYYTTDGSYLRLQINANGSSWTQQQWTLFYPDGRRVVGMYDQAQHLLDANGNGIHIAQQTENGHTVWYIADDFNRNMRIEDKFTSTATEREDKINVSGPNGPLEWRVKWIRVAVGAPGASYVCFEDEEFSPPLKYGCPLNINVWVVKYIQMPLAAAYSFAPPPAVPWTSFEFTYPPGTSYAQLASMRVPSGAVYSYNPLGYSANNYASSIAYSGYTSRTVTHDGEQQTWIYSQSGTGTATVTAPDGGQTIYYSYNPSIASSYWSRGLVYRIQEPGGTIRKRQWTRNRVFSLAGALNIDANNPYVERESVSIDAVDGQPRTAVTDFLIDKNGNTLSKKEYDWSTTLPGSAMEAPGSLLRTTVSSYHVSVPASTNNTNGTNRYWSPAAPLRLNAVARSTVNEGLSTVRAVVEFTYDDAFSKGNITGERRWDDATAGCISSTPLPSVCPVQQRAFDPVGNLTDIYEPTIRTHISYGGAGPYPTAVEYAPNTPDARSFGYSWNVTSGVLTSQTDLQNGTTTSYEYDAFGRQITVNESGLRISRTIFDDENRSVLVKRPLRAPDDGLLQTVTHTDQLGRVDMVRTSDGVALSMTGSDGIKIQTLRQTFIGGTRAITSSPYRTAGETGMQWTCTENDQAGRVVAVAQFKGGAPPSSCQAAANNTARTVTNYSSPSGTPRTRVTDPAGRAVERYPDGLGRLTTVIEDPDVAALTTTYQYGVFDNLRLSIQSGDGVTQQRQFGYSSLGRLISAYNPETGTLQFTYNQSGDLLTRADDRGFVTTLGYDALRRVTSRTFTNDGDITPDVSYSYHTGAPCVGQPLSVSSSAGTFSATACDALGRVLTSTQEIAGTAGPYTFNYSYWLNDSLASMQYPSGKVVEFDVDDAGRTSAIHTPTKPFADSLAYHADGRLSRLRFGNDLWETRSYPAPGEPTIFSLGSVDGASDKLELRYNFWPTSNNGNLQSQTIRRGSSAWSQTYAYDALNRLTCVTEILGTFPAVGCWPQNSWYQAYAYDRFGNRRVTSSLGFPTIDNHEFSTPEAINKSNNRLAGVTYDGAGNPGSYSPWTLSYDAENRITELTSQSNGNSTFAYDGAGRRIKKITTIPVPQTTLYIYDAAGRLAAEYSTAPSSPGTSYLFSDLLGTPRAVTSATGALQECSDYTPFGRLLQTSSRSLSCHQLPTHASQQFTGQVRDQGTELDFFGARYFSGSQGRFLSPDDLVAKSEWLSEPQRWNRYAYALNNPLKYVDPDGKDAIAAFFLGEQARDVSTWNVIFSKETLQQISKAWDVFAAEHNSMTGGWSPASVSKSDVALGAVFPVVGKVGKPLTRAATSVAGKLTPELIALAEKHLTSSGITVLGSYKVPMGALNYIEKAELKGASYFDIGDLWDPLVNARGDMNRHFLELIAKRGDTVLLSTPKGKIRRGTALADEIDILTKELNYQWVNQWALKPAK